MQMTAPGQLKNIPAFGRIIFLKDCLFHNAKHHIINIFNDIIHSGKLTDLSQDKSWVGTEIILSE
jgi:hypothetical protein